MSNTTNSVVRVTGTAVETAVSAAGIGISLATWQEYTTITAGIAGILLTLTMTARYIYQILTDGKKIIILEREVDERIRLEAQKAAEERVRLDSFQKYVVEHIDRRQHDLTPEQLFNEILKDEKMLLVLKLESSQGVLKSERD